MNIALLAGTKSNTAFNMTREEEESMGFGITFLAINSWYKLLASTNLYLVKENKLLPTVGLSVFFL